jgi:hypothetical protein
MTPALVIDLQTGVARIDEEKLTIFSSLSCITIVGDDNLKCLRDALNKQLPPTLKDAPEQFTTELAVDLITALRQIYNGRFRNNTRDRLNDTKMAAIAGDTLDKHGLLERSDL